MELRSSKNRYILGFDGIRALAVIAVILYHFLPNTFSGGYLGVSIFFVVSGYLITDLLRQEFDKKNTIDIKSFYLRRIKRLYPALVCMLLVTLAFITLFDRGALLNIRTAVLTNLLYVYNLWAINHGQSYFQQFTAPSPVTHLWSLSVEGQFYLIWPILVLLLAKLKIRRRYIAIGLGIMATLSAIMLAITFSPNTINRAYYGTDTRLFAILLGAMLAYVWPSAKLTPSMAPANQRVLNYLSWISLAGLALGFATLNGQSSITYYGGMFLFTIMGMLLVATIAAPTTWLVKIFNWPIFRWIGTRSYGIYLYQYPILVFFDQLKLKYRQLDLYFLVIELILICLISEVSYRWLEQPLRHVTFADVKMFFNRILQLNYRSIAQLMITVILILIASLGMAAPEAASSYQPPLEKELSAREKEAEATNAKILAEQKAAKNTQNDTNDKKSTFSKQLSKADDKLATTYEFTPDQLDVLKQTSVTAIGDSMLVNIGPTLQKFMPIVTNGKVGRQPSTAPSLLTTIKSDGQLSDNILIMLGTNGAVKPGMLAQVMDLVGNNRQVFWVNNYVQNRSWIPGNEQVYAQASKNYPNFHLIDWQQHVQNHLNWLGPDEIHPNPLGDKYLAHLIGSTIVTISAEKH
ncbi:acyltransferase family protein [Periweissella fabalis]|uniref:Acyltransferase n=1 Tax=Periweissella fabalis TaxID=1070421 RepID=A0A7X6S3L9_9LACO|nr:acyltransferase family protein [Periweissella fabalis]MCM0598123.1 acyltransferase [Periweissella fabalis]NKZ24753.1 acyltransferase [Periweissella fabalis]